MPPNDALAPADPNGRKLSGRDAELEALQSLLAEARHTRTIRLVILAGPEGVGRSSLLAELARLWAAEGVSVASARSPGDLIKQLAGALARDGQSLESMGRDKPVALLIDDLDAADLESQAQVAKLLPGLMRPASTRATDELVLGGIAVLVVGDRPLANGLQAALANARTITLAPFDSASLRRFLSEGALSDRLLAATGGVPARIEELLSGTVDFARRRLERLSGADRDVLSVLAVLRRPEPARFIGSLAGSSGATERLKSLAEVGWVAATPDLGRTHYGLARESDRQTLLAALPHDQIVALARAAGSQYAALGHEEAAFAAFEAADEVPRAVEIGLRLVDRQVSQGQVTSAEAILTSLARRSLPVEQRRDVQLRLADLLERRQDFRGALASLGRARSATPAAGRSALRARIARLCISLGAVTAAERLARKVLEHDRDNGEAAVAFAEARFLRGAYDEAIQFVAEESRVAPALRVALENVRGKALLTLGRLDEARRIFQSNAVRAEAAGLPVERVRALLNVGVVAHRQGNRDEARQAYAAALSAGDVPFTPVVRANLASLHFEEGETEKAIGEAHRALAAFVQSGRTKEESHATQNLARFYLFAGDLKRAGEIARHAGDLARRVGDPYLSAGARLVAAEVALRQGEVAAPEHLGQVAEEFRALGNQRYRCEALLLLAEAHLGRKDVASAQAVLNEAPVTSFAALVPESHLLHAELSLLAGDATSASEQLKRAHEGLIAAPHVELPARLYSLLAQLADVRGEADVARAERLKALSILERLASGVPIDLRSLFFARPGRRSIVEQAGRLLPEIAPRAMPVSLREQPVALVGKAPSIVRINQLIDRIGPSSATVLIRGESGTGKERVAKALHERSPRRDMPLIAVNCGALSEELLLSELFGHERGAFTGAVRERRGRFELAAGGTIFLDEIGDISPRAQVALLRVLQERTFERVGGHRTIAVDVRVICATNRPLEELMRKGLFREDLYYRLRGTTLTLPPLREHIDDLPTLAETYLSRLERPRRLSREAQQLLERHTWPGNVRELFHLLESASLLAIGDVIGPEAFELYPELFPAPGEVPKPRPILSGEGAVQPSSELDFYGLLRQKDLSLKDLRRELDLACISQALQEASGNISEAARLLKMKRSRLSQVVNAEPTLRALCRGPLPDAGTDEGDDGDGPILAEPVRRRNGAME